MSEPWYGDASPSEITAVVSYLRSPSTTAARKLVSAGIVRRPPETGVTERGETILRLVVARMATGLIEQRYCAETGHRVSLYEAAALGLEREGLPYVLVCEPHDTDVGFRSIREARSWIPKAGDWCPVCSGKEE